MVVILVTICYALVKRCITELRKPRLYLNYSIYTVSYYSMRNIYILNKGITKKLSQPSH